MRKFFASLMVASLIGVPTLVGCTREVSHTTEVKHGPLGGTKVEETRVTENPDGTLNTEHSTKKVNP